MWSIMSQNEALEAVLVPVVAALGYELWGYELLLGQNALCVYVDSESGVTIEGCSKIMRHLSDVLDVEQVLPDNCSLEVSSPGIERRLFKAEHFSRYIGSPVKMHFTELVAGRRQTNATIKAVNAEGLTLQVEDSDLVVSWNLIAKAKLIIK